MNDLYQKILEMKRKGTSLRKIATAMGVSHTTVMRRLREMNQAPGTGVTRDESADVTDKGRCNTSRNPHLPRLPEESKVTINQVLQKKTPSLSPASSVNPLKTSSAKATEGKKKGNSPRSDDLIGEIVQFLESKGLEVYPMQNGGYQVKGNRVKVRFYISGQDE